MIPYRAGVGSGGAEAEAVKAMECCLTTTVASSLTDGVLWWKRFGSNAKEYAGVDHLTSKGQFARGHDEDSRYTVRLTGHL